MFKSRNIGGADLVFLCARIDEQKSTAAKLGCLRRVLPDAPPRLRVLVQILLVTFVFLTHSADVPDEWWQSTEVAYQTAMRIQFGEAFASPMNIASAATLAPLNTFEARFGGAPWEWRPPYLLRSFVFPTPLVITYIAITQLFRLLWRVVCVLVPDPSSLAGASLYLPWLESLAFYVAPRVLGCVVAYALFMSTIRVAQLLASERCGFYTLVGEKSTISSMDLIKRQKILHGAFRVTSALLTANFMFAYTSPRLLSNCSEALVLMYAFEVLGAAALEANPKSEIEATAEGGEGFVPAPYPGRATNRRREQEAELNRLLVQSLVAADAHSIWGHRSKRQYWHWLRLLAVTGVGCCLRCTFAVPAAVVLVSFLVFVLVANTSRPGTAPKPAFPNGIVTAERIVLFLVMGVVSVALFVFLQVAIDSFGYSILLGMSYDGPVFTTLNFLRFNFLSGNSALFGSHPVYWYITSVIPANLGPHLILGVFVLCWRMWLDRGNNKPTQFEHGRKVLLTTMVATCAFTLAVYSTLEHKEMRFAFPVTTCPVIAIIAGRLLPEWSISSEGGTQNQEVPLADAARRRLFIRAVRLMVQLSSLSTLLLLGVVGWGMKCGPTQVTAALRSGRFVVGDIIPIAAGRGGGAQQPSQHHNHPIEVHVLAGCYTLPGPSFHHIPLLHSHLPPSYATAVETALPHLVNISVRSVSCADMTILGGRRLPTEHELFLKNPSSFVEYAYGGLGATPPAEPRSLAQVSPKSLRGILEQPLAALVETISTFSDFALSLQSKAAIGIRSDEVEGSTKPNAHPHSNISAALNELRLRMVPSVGLPPSILLPATTTRSTPLPDLVVVFSGAHNDGVRDFFMRRHFMLLESFFHGVVVVDEGAGHWLEVWGRKRGGGTPRRKPPTTPPP